MRYKGKIKKINHIVISDPSYDSDVSCRYDKNDINQENWSIDIDIHSTKTPITEKYFAKGTEFYLLLCKDNRLCRLKEKGTIMYIKGIEITETDIGIDTACVALGINEKADEISNLMASWQPECSLKTLADGLFGTVKEGKIDDDVVFVWVSGYLDKDTGYSIEEIVEYLQYQLNIADLKKDIDLNKQEDIELDI